MVWDHRASMQSLPGKFRSLYTQSWLSGRLPGAAMLSLLQKPGCHMQARGLADKVADDPPTIKLKFEHKATDQLKGSDDFYTHSKENR